MTYYSFTWRKTVAKTVVFTNVKVVIYKIMNALVVKLVDTKDLKSTYTYLRYKTITLA